MAADFIETLRFSFSDARERRRLMAKKREQFFLKNGSLLQEKLLSSLNGKSNPIRSFSLRDIKEATDNYNSDLIFENWAYSCWYKGCFQGRLVSVRRFDEMDDDDDLLQRVIKEISFATQMSAQKNVLKLLGCCLETQIPILVYEFPGNALPLHEAIHTPDDGTQRQCLPWQSRLRIAGEIANVVAYLHTAFPRPVIHREVTLSFFFLDQNNVPKLSNFLIAIELPEGKKHVVDEVRGIRGYIAPEYIMTGMFTEKIDVFSFGKLVLDLLTGKNYNFGSDPPLVDYVKNRLENHDLGGFVDARILPKEGGSEVHEIHRLVAVTRLALKCVNDTAEQRPTMVEVAKELKRILRFVA